MRGPAPVVAAAGLLLLGAAALFPPLKRPADLGGGSAGPLGSRAFLLSGEYMFYADQGGQRVGKPGAEIDPGRLLAEALVILSGAGSGSSPPGTSCRTGPNPSMAVKVNSRTANGE